MNTIILAAKAPDWLVPIFYYLRQFFDTPAQQREEIINQILEFIPIVFCSVLFGLVLCYSLILHVPATKQEKREEREERFFSFACIMAGVDFASAFLPDTLEFTLASSIAESMIIILVTHLCFKCNWGRSFGIWGMTFVLTMGLGGLGLLVLNTIFG